MSKATLLAIGLSCLVIAGCDQKQPTTMVASTPNAPISLKILDSVVARRVPIQIGGEGIEATVFAKDLGDSAFFLCHYVLPAMADDMQARDRAVNAEIDRCVANVGAEVVSRKISPVADQSTGDVVAKSPQKRSHSIRCRVICTGKEIHSLTAVTPDSQEARDLQALDTMFQEFGAK